MKLFFCGCARDCADSVATNIASLLSLGDSPWCDAVRVYVAENNSKDDTRKEIVRLAERDPRVTPVLLDDLDGSIPEREARIAFCRERLLEEVRRQADDGLYVPIDLDSAIAESLEPESFREACRLVESGACTGVFPSSTPYYYDIFALREREWCPANCWHEMLNAEAKGQCRYLLRYIRYVASRQKPCSELRSRGLIPVDSAFGGVAIYSLAKVVEHNAHYVPVGAANGSLGECEHVIFNAALADLCIKPDWVVTAPPEHIAFRRLPAWRQLTAVGRAGLRDIKQVAVRVGRRARERMFGSVAR